MNFGSLSIQHKTKNKKCTRTAISANLKSNKIKDDKFNINVRILIVIKGTDAKRKDTQKSRSLHL